MLYKPYNSVNLEHLQGALISDSDCIRMVNEIKNARHIFDRKFTIPDMNPLMRSVMSDDPELGSSTDKKPDQELVNIIMWVLGRNEVSVNGLKEKFQMGNRANNFIDKLCEFGIVSEKFAKKPRNVLPQSVEDLSEDVKDLLNNGGITDEQIQTVLENRT